MTNQVTLDFAAYQSANRCEVEMVCDAIDVSVHSEGRETLVVNGNDRLHSLFYDESSLIMEGEAVWYQGHNLQGLPWQVKMIYTR